MHAADAGLVDAESRRSTTPPSRADTEEEEEEEAAAAAVPEAERRGSVGSSSSASPVHPPTRHRPSVARRTTTRTLTRVEDELMEYLDRHPTAVQRVVEHRWQHSHTVGWRRAGAGADVELPSFGGKKPYPPPLPDREEYVVEFDGHDDPRHAMNWPARKKSIVAAILIFDCLAESFASSIFSPAAISVQQEFHTGRHVVTLATTLFMLGFAAGPVVFAPMSELYGRRWPIIIAAFSFGIFHIGVAVARDYQTLIICRFFAGFFGSAPLPITAAVFADMYSNAHRGIAVSIFFGMVVNGPLLAPFVGGFIASSYLGWRWVAYIPALMGFAAGTLALFFQHETYGPVILVSKASELRRLTRNWGIHAKQEEVEVDLDQLASKNLMRPLRILFTEPIVLLITIYTSFLYGLVYLSLTAYGVVFGQIHGFGPGVDGLPYLGMVVGVCFGAALVIADSPGYSNKLKANHNIPVPEWRVPIMMVGTVSFTIGLFWFGWTGYTKSIPWIVPTLAGLALGFGISTVFLQCLNYIIDAYLTFAASAIAANALMRSLCGAVFPLFASSMYEGIGVNWGMTLLGCFSALFIPMPFVLYFHGRTIRARSKFAPAPDIEHDTRRDEESAGGGEADEMGSDADASADSSSHAEKEA